jgi:hypothetical protein
MLWSFVSCQSDAAAQVSACNDLLYQAFSSQHLMYALDAHM